MLSFKTSEFFPVLEQYNQDFWPLQVLAFVLALAIVLLSVKNTKWKTRVIFSLLAFFWLWTGLVFCLLYWGPNYIYAYFFALIFTIQGGFFIKQSIQPSFNFTFKIGFRSTIALLLLVYAMLGYQILGIALDHIYPRFFSVGLVPCPTIIFTLGLFLLANKKIPNYLLILQIIGAFSLVIAVFSGIYEDIGVLIAGIVAIILILPKRPKTA